MVGHDGATVRERIDRSCELLASEYRRRVIYALQRDGPATVDDLADALVAAGLNDSRKQALISLVHTQLPKLDDHGVVEYSSPDEEVSLAEGVEPLEPFLEIAAREEAAADFEQLPALDAGVSDAVGSSSSD